MKALNADTIKIIQREYLNSKSSWYLGFSGGKDSSVLLLLLLVALSNIKEQEKIVKVIYCDTGVEIPIVTEHTLKVLRNLKTEVRKKGYPIEVVIAKPALKDTFFVKVIGRGYPPPTNRFRWCTRRLRTTPIKKVFNSPNDNQNIILLGTRNGESPQRDRTLLNHATDSKYFFTQNNNRSTLIFSPLINYSTEDIWTTIQKDYFPNIINSTELIDLYKNAGSENPLIETSGGTCYGSSRFGCWTCTVIRKDKAVTSLINNGFQRLEPLLEFRDWLAILREDTNFRCKVRRNGMRGLGPITLEGRKTILDKLLETQDRSGYELISDDEILTINKLWKDDIESTSYLED